MVRLPLLLAALLTATALGARGKKAVPPPLPETTAPAVETAPVVPRPSSPPLQDPLPVDLGPLPQGLANASAQGCHACHADVYGAWVGSAHARGITPELAEAARAAGTPACLSCHLPLQQQHAALTRYDHGDIHAVETRPNRAWSPTLQAEGVTCVACHVHDGKVVGPRPPKQAPHTSGWSSTLQEAEACATCHQLTWPGASKPFYDTFGEWSRSGWAEAGVTCQDCHMGPGAGAVRAGADHGFRADPARAVSVLVDLSAPTLVRGAGPVDVALTLQNTGAGHHVPSGSPLTGLLVEAALVRDADGEVVGTPFTATLGQVLGDAPPWPVLEDTRLAAGATRTWRFDVALPHAAKAGPHHLAVRLVRTTRGERREVASDRRIAIVVE